MKKINAIAYSNNYYKFFATSGKELAVLTVELSSDQVKDFALPTAYKVPTEVTINAGLKAFLSQHTFGQPAALPIGPKLTVPLVF